MFLTIISSVVLIIGAVSIGIQLFSRRKNKFQGIVHTLFYRTQHPGAGAWGLGSWSYGTWDVGEKLNDSIKEGQARYSHQRPHHRQSQNKYRHKEHEMSHLYLLGVTILSMLLANPLKWIGVENGHLL